MPKQTTKPARCPCGAVPVIGKNRNGWHAACINFEVHESGTVKFLRARGTTENGAILAWNEEVQKYGMEKSRNKKGR